MAGPLGGNPGAVSCAQRCPWRREFSRFSPDGTCELRPNICSFRPKGPVESEGGRGPRDGPLSGYLLAMKSLFRYRPTKDYPARTRNQEQIRMIATAIGKPMANAPPIARVNAESRFAAGRRLSTDMLLTPPIGKSKSRHRGRSGHGLLARPHCVQKPRARVPQDG